MIGTTLVEASPVIEQFHWWCVYNVVDYGQEIDLTLKYKLLKNFGCCCRIFKIHDW